MVCVTAQDRKSSVSLVRHLCRPSLRCQFENVEAAYHRGERLSKFMRERGEKLVVVTRGDFERAHVCLKPRVPCSDVAALNQKAYPFGNGAIGKHSAEHQVDASSILAKTLLRVRFYDPRRKALFDRPHGRPGQSLQRRHGFG
jgi:hypothetical protein